MSASAFEVSNSRQRVEPGTSRLSDERPKALGRLACLFAMASVLLADPAAAAIRYAKPAATGAGTCATWANACTLQTALSGAPSGDEVWATAGIHKPSTTGDRAAWYSLKSGVGIYGGFAGTETLRTQRNWTTNVTVLSGDLAGNDTTDANGVVLDWSAIVGTDNSRSVLYAGFVAASAVLDGVTVTGGYSEASNTIGGGLFSYVSSPTLANVVFRGNRVISAGGAIYFWEGSPTMTNVSFIGNGAQSGGGVYLRQCPTATLTNVRFESNDAVDAGGNALGGGLAGDGTTVTLTNVQFIGNTAESGGGLSAYSPMTLTNVLFEGNSASSPNGGGGGFNGEGCPTMIDVTFSNNTSAGHGGGMYCQIGTGSITRAIFSSNTSRLGAGLEVAAATMTVTDAVFAGNSASDSAGGLLSWNSTLTLSNAAIRGNRVGVSEGAGLAIWSGSATLTGVTISGNQSTSTGGLYSTGALQARNTIVWGNGGSEVSVGGGTATLDYSLVEGGCPTGATCNHVVTADPLFVTPIDPATAPTTAGDLQLLPASAAIDAGNNDVTSPSLPATDLAGHVRRSDAPGVPDTGNGTPPIVDIGAYEFAGPAPDLTVTKANNAGAGGSPGTPFTWTLTVTNTGSTSAAFAAGETVLRDDLPSAGATYGTVTVTPTNVTGTVVCAVDGSAALLCAASTAVSVGGTTGRLVITIPVTPSIAGTLANPRAAGTCLVDPNNVVDESGEANNACANSVTVNPLTPTLATAVHDSAHNVITSAPVGASIHGQATVTGTGPTPTGSMTLGIYGNATCSGPPVTTETVPLVGGVAESSSISAVSFYYQVTYSGDAVYTGVTGACTLFSAYQPGPTFTVNTLADDVGDGLCSDVHCTLREAVTAANADPASNTVAFSVTGTISLGSTLPALVGSGSLTIDGTGQSVVVSGSSAYRVFTVDALANVSIRRLTIADGSMPSGTGAGIFTGGTLSLSDSTLTGNSAEHAGALHVAGGNTSLVNVTLTGNVSTSMHGFYGGGAAAISEGVATFLNCTVSGNSTNNIEPQLSAGGLVNTASVTLTNTLVAGNASPTFKPDLAGTFTSGGNNVVGNGDGVSGLANGVLGDLVGSGASPVNALLAPLGAYGGPTQTMALLPGSPAIDGVTYNAPNGCPPADQRAVARPQGAACDVGAFESQGFAAAASAGTPQSAVIGTVFATPLAVEVTSAFGEPVAGGIVPFSAPAAGASATLPGGGSTATATIDGSGQASVVATANGTVGSYLVTATPRGATSAPTFSLTNTPLTSGLTLVSAPNPSVYGDTVIFTATLAPAVTGATITFLEGATPLGTAATDASGVAAFSTSALQVGTHAINASWPGDSTHSGATSTPVSQVVSPRPVTVAADAKSKAYGEADPPLTYQLTIGSLVPGDTFTGALTRTPGETVCPYPILQGTLALPANYTLTYVGADLTIGTRAVTVTADAKSKVFGAPDPALTYQVTSGSLVAGDTFTGALVRTPGEDLGTYPILQGTLALSGNYALSYVGASLTIATRAITVTADPQSKAYGTADPALNYQVTSGSLLPGDAFAGGLTRAAGETVGTYAILQGTLTLPAGYALGYVGANLTIGTRAITVTADPQNKVYGAPDPALTYQVTSGSLVTGDAFTGALTRTPGEAVGTYPILQGTLALSANYALTYAGANLTIGTRVVRVTADPQSKVYGETDPALTFQVTSGSLLPGDTFTGSLARAPGETAGTYAILQGTLSLPSSYALGYVGASFAIEAASTTTTLSGTPSSAALGETVHLVATVAAVPPGTGTPSGVIAILDGSTILCSGVALDVAGLASCDVVAATPVGLHNLTAQFEGSASWLASSGTFALEVFGAAPVFTSPTAATFSVGVSRSFTIRATGTPAPTITITDGTLPAGLTFVDNGDGTATISGVAEWSGIGSHALTLSAGNGAGSTAQDFVLRVVDFAQIPTLDWTGLSALALLLALVGAIALRRSASA